MKKILIVFFLCLLYFMTSAQKFKYGVEVGYGINKTNTEIEIYDKYLEDYLEYRESYNGQYLWDYLGMWYSEGNEFYLSGSVGYIPIKWVKIQSGVGINTIRREFREYNSGIHDDYKHYHMSFLKIPLLVILLDNCWIKPFAGLNSSLRLFTSENLRSVFNHWEQDSNALDFELNTHWYQFDYEFGIKIQIWKVELSISKYAGLSPYLVVPDYYEELPDGTETESKGKIKYFNSGLQFNLLVPIGEFELK